MVFSSFFEFSRKYLSIIPKGVEVADPDPITSIDRGFPVLLQAGHELEAEVLREFIADVLKIINVKAADTLAEAKLQLAAQFDLKTELAGLETIFSSVSKGLDNAAYALYLCLAVEAPRTKKEIPLASAHHPLGKFGMSATREDKLIEAVCLDEHNDGLVELHETYGLTAFVLAKPGSEAPQSDKYAYVKGHLAANAVQMPIWIAQSADVNVHHATLFTKYELHQIRNFADTTERTAFVKSAPIDALRTTAAPAAQTNASIEEIINGMKNNSFPYPSPSYTAKEAREEEKVTFALLNDSFGFCKFMNYVARMPQRKPTMLMSLYQESKSYPEYNLTVEVARDLAKYLSVAGQSCDSTARQMSRHSCRKAGDVFKQYSPFVREIARLAGKADFISQVISELMRDYSHYLTIRGARECTFPENVFMELIKPDSLISRVGELLSEANYLESGAFNATKFTFALKIVAFLVGHHISNRPQKYHVAKIDAAEAYCVFYNTNA